MAERYVALIRGINVGRAKRVAMADLRAMISALGYSDVRTLLNSGNAVFTAVSADPAALAAQLERALGEHLGVEARIVVLSASALDAAVASNPFRDDGLDPSRLLVVFSATHSALSLLQPLVEAEWTPEAFVMGDGVAFMWCPDGVSRSRVAVALDAAARDTVTSRNWGTVLKLQRLVNNHE